MVSPHQTQCPDPSAYGVFCPGKVCCAKTPTFRFFSMKLSEEGCRCCYGSKGSADNIAQKDSMSKYSREIVFMPRPNSADEAHVNSARRSYYQAGSSLRGKPADVRACSKLFDQRFFK